MRILPLLIICGLLLLSACGSDDESGFSFKRTLPPQTKSNGELSAVLQVNPDLANHFELIAGQGRACIFGRRSAGLSLDGYLSCWGRKIHPTERNQVSSIVKGNDKMLSIGEDHVCMTLSNFGGRRVHCDGSNDFGENTDPDAINHNDEITTGHWLKNPAMVASGNRHNCALDVYGVHCWGDNRKGQTDVPVLSNPKWLAAGGDTTCAIDEDDQPVCWGDNSSGQTDIPSGLTSVTRLAVGADFVCAVNVGQVECWGNTGDWDVPSGSYTEVVHVSAGKDHVCVLDRTQLSPEITSANCFGRENTSQNLLTVPAAIQTNIRTISAGHGFTCASNTYDGYKWSNNPEEITDELEPQLGVLCWGDEAEEQTKVPKELCLGYHNEPVIMDERNCP